MPEGLSRRTVMGGAFATALIAGVTACDAKHAETHALGPTGAPAPKPSETATASAEPATITVGGQQAGSPLPFGALVTLTSSVPLREMAVRDGDGTEIAGSLAKDGGSWVSSGPMGPSASWSWTATTPGGGVSHGTVGSTAAIQAVRATANIGVGRTVGVAAPIVLDFQTKVTDPAAVEKYLQVLIRPTGSSGPWQPVTGSWAWLPDNAPNSTAHFRTKDFWPAHTDVHVIAPLAHVNWGDGVTGLQDFDWQFSIGRSQVVVADARKHNIVIYRDGAEVATYPASYGLDSDPRRNTRSGINIITDKVQTIEMKSKTFHYDEIEHWAVRFNNNGQFIHANPATVADQGKTNVSHGCINLSTADAKAFYPTAIYGDPVEVSGTGVQLADTRTELYDWALSWQQWKAMSALA